MVLSRLHIWCEIFCLLLFSLDTLEEVLIEESSSIESLHAPRGGSVELPCDVTPALADDSMALVIWYKQGHDAPIYSVDLREDVTSYWSDPSTLGARATFRSDSEPAVLVITNLRAEDSGQYRCRVDFIKSPTKNTRLNFTVLIPPERLMILNLEGDEVRGGVLGPYDEGTDVNITCVAIGGRPPPRVSWWKSHALLANSETRASIAFTLNRSDYGTNITCQAVTDPSIPPLSQTVTIDINLRLLRLELLGGKRPLVAGQSSELVCQAVGARPKPSMSWWKGGERLKTVRETVSTDGNVTSSILTFVPSIDDSGRVLSCRAVQPNLPHSTREDGWRLEIQHLPVVKLKLGANLDADAVVEGSDVYLDCMVKANPWHTHVYFTHNGMAVKPGPGVLLANQSLVLQHVSRRVAGAYVCAARSALGEGASDTLILDVKYSPTCRSQQPTVIRAARGEQVDMSCDLDANPREPMTYQWWFNSSTHDKHELVSTETLGGRYSYTVSSSGDYGWVQCAGANVVGRQATPCVFTILPAEKPSPVRNCSVSNVTYDSLRMTCERGHDGGVRQAFVLQVFDIATNLLLRNLSGDQPNFVVWGLADSSAVRLSIRAYNEKGQSEPVTITSSLLKIYQKHTASVPVTVELSTVLLLVLGAVALTAAGAALVASVLCCKFCGKRRDKNDKAIRKEDGSSNKPLTGAECESIDSIDKNPDIIPIEGKMDTCSNKSSNTDRSSTRPLISKTLNFDAAANCERYYESYPFNRYDVPIDFRPYRPNLPMPNIGPSVQNVGPNMPCVGPECGVPHDLVYEDWLKYRNTTLDSTRSLSMHKFPVEPLFPAQQYRVLSHTLRRDTDGQTKTRTENQLTCPQ